MKYHSLKVAKWNLNINAICHHYPFVKDAETLFLSRNCTLFLFLLDLIDLFLLPSCILMKNSYDSLLPPNHIVYNRNVHIPVKLKT